MAPPQSWADLCPELLHCIADRVDLGCYVALRGVCSPWRSTLEPASPSILLITDESRPTRKRKRHVDASVFCLPSRRTLHLPKLRRDHSVVGTSNGWLAVAFPARKCLGVDNSHIVLRIALMNPITGKKIHLPDLKNYGGSLPKLVFSPNPSHGDFIAAFVVYDTISINELAYVRAGEDTWHVQRLGVTENDWLIDVVCHDGGAGVGKVYCLTVRGDVHVMTLPRDLRQAPADEPLVPRRAGFKSFRPADLFAAPYAPAADLACGKNLVICDGSLYQIWRNNVCTVSWMLPGGGGRFRMPSNSVFVLRYYPGRPQPCWDVVNDLGGHAVFLGKNNAVALRADGIPGLRGNCMYWTIDGWCSDEAVMMFDMETRTSTRCFSPSTGGAMPGHVRQLICWYFWNDATTANNNGGTLH